MKKLVKAVCLLMLGVCLAGCNRDTVGKTDVTENGSPDSEETNVTGGISMGTGVNYSERVGLYILSEAGVFDTQDYILHLYTIDEGYDMVFCYDPNCKHSHARDTSGNPKCMAALYDSEVNDIGYYKGAIYFWKNISNTAHQIYRMDTNNTTRELVAELPHKADIKFLTTFCDDKVYYNAKIINTDEATGKGYFTYRVMEVDLLTGAYRYITEPIDDMVIEIDVAGNTFYTKTKCDSDGNPYAVAQDLVTLEETVIISKEEFKEGYRYTDVIDEDSYFFSNKETGRYGIKNIDGTIERILLRGPEGEDLGVQASDKWLYYHRQTDYNSENAGDYLMEVETGKIINITKQKEKYNLMWYNGSYDAFVGSNHAEDGRTILNPTMYSREKILSEAKQ